QTAPVVFLLIDPDGRVVRFNATGEQLLGYADDDEVRGRRFWDVFVAQEDRERAKGMLAALAAGAGAVEQELRWRAKDGRGLIVATSSAPILDGSGKLRFIVCGLDVTERERHLAELRASRAR